MWVEEDESGRKPRGFGGLRSPNRRALSGEGSPLKKDAATVASPSPKSPNRSKLGKRQWRFSYPKDAEREELLEAQQNLRRALLGSTYCNVVGGTHDRVGGTYDQGRRNILQHEASETINEWVETHGYSEPGSSRENCIGAPADLMIAMISCHDEASGQVVDANDEDDAASAWDAVLSWISPADGYELEDDGSRGRLIQLMRLLDADNDGRLSAKDLEATVRINAITVAEVHAP